MVHWLVCFRKKSFWHFVAVHDLYSCRMIQLSFSCNWSQSSCRLTLSIAACWLAAPHKTVLPALGENNLQVSRRGFWVRALVLSRAGRVPEDLSVLGNRNGNLPAFREGWRGRRGSTLITKLHCMEAVRYFSSKQHSQTRKDPSVRTCWAIAILGSAVKKKKKIQWRNEERHLRRQYAFSRHSAMHTGGTNAWQTDG